MTIVRRMVRAARRCGSVALAIAVTLFWGSGCGGDGSPAQPTPVLWTIAQTDSSSSVLRSDDLGASWAVRLQPESFAADLEFVDATTGWVVGGSRIARTTDGGATWTEQEIPPEHDGADLVLSAVRFFDATRGLVTGTEWKSVQSRPYVLRYSRALWTQDGGETWEEPEGILPNGPGSSAGTPCLAGQGVGFVAGPLRVTDSYGQFWLTTSEDFSDAGLAFTCTEDDTLWKLDLDYNSAIERYYPVVAVSDDRGRSWSDRTATVAAFFRPTPDQQTADPTELRTSPVGIAFSGTSDGWILLTERRLATATHHLLLRTSDAGASWERLPDPPFPAPSDPDLYFGDGFTTISLGSRGYGALSGASCVLADGESCVAPALVITSDGGRSFTASDPQPVLDSPLRRVQRVVFAW